jgi:hypothetical protein
MDKLIEALQIFLKYGNYEYPTVCLHDELIIDKITREMVSDADHKRLDKLGFIWSEEEEYYHSFKYGS